MALDTNIALGVRPIEQPNMLAQMGQMMQLRQLKQEYEGTNALRDAFASGGSLSDPAFVQRLRAANPKMALDIEAKYLAGQKTQSELLGAAYKNSREALTMVNSPESLRAYTVSQFNDPVMGPALKARGLTPEIALANLDREIATSGFNTVLKKSAMGLDSFFKDETSRRNTDVSSGPGYLQAGIAREKLTAEQRQQAQIDAISGRNTPVTPPMSTPMSGGGGGPLGSGTFVIPTGTPTGRPNALVQGTPSNMLIPGAQAPATAPSNDPYDRIAAIDREIAKYPINNPKSLPILQALNAQRTQLLASAKNQYGGALVDMAVPDPANPGKFITVKGRPNQYGVLEPVEMGGIPLSTNASAAGGTTISPTVARPAPSAPVWNEKTGVWMTPPTSENPKGTAVENPEVRSIVQTRAANATLKVAGYDPKTGTDEVSSLIKKSTSGLGENWANKAWSAITGTGSEGAEAIAKLETRANEMTLALAPNGSLGAGFSNEDRTFMLGKLGDVANPNKPMNVRLAAWEDVMERTARNAGVPYTKQSYGGSSSNKPAAPSTALPKGFKLD